jgi:peptidoglycan/LPS O-acetylase OafA/YrhL
MGVTLLFVVIGSENSLCPVENFWANFLLINNYIPYKNQFFAWTWTLAIEEQFYLLIPLFLSFSLSKGKKFIWASFIFLILAAFFIRYFVVFSSSTPIRLLIHPAFGEVDYYTYFDTLYAKTHTRFGTLLMGVLAAYLKEMTGFFSWIKNRKTLRKLLMIIPVVIILGIFKSMDFFRPSYSIWFLTFFRYGYSFCITCLMIYFLLKGDEVGPIASHKCFKWIFHSISTLSYSAYLIHILLFYFGLRALYYNQMTNAEYYMIFLFLCLVAFVLSLFMYVFIEQPFLNLRQKIVKTYRT